MKAVNLKWKIVVLRKVWLM